MKRVTAVFCSMLFFCCPIATFAAVQTQLPFLDGAMFECTQNSDDSPTHGRDQNYNVVSAPSTNYDLDFTMPQGTILTAAIDGTAYTGYSAGFGNYIKIDSGSGYFALVGHLMNNGCI